MKKIFTLLAIIFCVATASAQRASDMGDFSGDYDSDEDWNHSSVFVEAAVGPYVGMYASDYGLGCAVAVGYRLHIANGFCWDIAKIGFSAGLSDIEYSSGLRFLTGLRYNSPCVIGDKSIYINAAAGYHMVLEHSYCSGIAYEAGFGVNLTRHISLGFTCEGGKSDYDENLAMLGLKLGVQF